MCIRDRALSYFYYYLLCCLVSAFYQCLIFNLQHLVIHDLFWPKIPEGFLTEDFSAFNFNSIPLTRLATCWQLPKLQSLYVHSPADQISQDGMKGGIRKKEYSKMIKAEWDELVYEWNWVDKVLTCKAVCPLWMAVHAQHCATVPLILSVSIGLH